MHMACVTFRMSLEEVLAAATINAAKSIGRAATHGSLEVGKVADMLIINAPRYYVKRGHFISIILFAGSVDARIVF